VKKVLVVFGTRPEAIKMAPVITELKSQSHTFETYVCVTAQHREMLDQVLSLFEIKPDIDLNIMKHNQELYELTSSIVIKMRDVLRQIEPDLVVVHGDTTTSMITALAAFYKHIPVAHVEAGLRTNHMYSPWPEEINRQITARLTKYHFAPTEQARQNLLNENIAANDIEVTGNTIIDALLAVSSVLETKEEIRRKIQSQIITMGYDLTRLDSRRKLVLITGHRRENFGNGFLNICNAINNLAELHPDVDFLYPLHLNPNVRMVALNTLQTRGPNSNIFICEPLEYMQFIYMMSKAYIILTDSGGIQEEAPCLRKPVLVMRDTSERPEAIKAGTARLVGTNMDRIIQNVNILLGSPDEYDRMRNAKNPYGDGNAAKKIISFLIEKFQ